MHVNLPLKALTRYSTLLTLFTRFLRCLRLRDYLAPTTNRERRGAITRPCIPIRTQGRGTFGRIGGCRLTLRPLLVARRRRDLCVGDVHDFRVRFLRPLHLVASAMGTSAGFFGITCQGAVNGLASCTLSIFNMVRPPLHLATTPRRQSQAPSCAPGRTTPMIERGSRRCGTRSSATMVR